MDEREKKKPQYIDWICYDMMICYGRRFADYNCPSWILESCIFTNSCKFKDFSQLHLSVTIFSYYCNISAKKGKVVEFLHYLWLILYNSKSLQFWTQFWKIPIANSVSSGSNINNKPSQDPGGADYKLISTHLTLHQWTLTDTYQKAGWLYLSETLK